MNKQEEFEIEAETPEVTAQTTYWDLYLTINDKQVYVRRYVSCDDILGVYDNGLEIDEDSDELTEEEKEAVEEYCNEKVKWR